MQSREGIPLGSDRNCPSQSWRFSAQRWMAVGPSLPHNMPHTAITTTSTKRCFRFRVCRGSESDSKYEPIDSTFTHFVAMRHILARGRRTLRAICDRTNVRAPPYARCTIIRSVALVFVDYLFMRAGRDGLADGGRILLTVSRMVAGSPLVS